MRTVMIVDDETWIRRGLIQSIPWEQFDLKLVGESNDGEEAYEMALALKPNLLFLDMRMPGLDGKQLIGMLRRDLPELLTVVVSGYSDFEYTKEAIRHNAFEYLLKPVKKEELIAVLEKAVIELGKQEVARRRATQETKEDWLHYMLFSPEDDLDSQDDRANLIAIPDNWNQAEYLVMVGQPDVFRDNGDMSQLVSKLSNRLSLDKPFLFEGLWEYYVTAHPDGLHEVVIAICGKRLNPPDIQRLYASIEAAIKESSYEGTLSFGYSLKNNAPQALLKASLEAGVALRMKKLTDTSVLLSKKNQTNSPAGAYPSEIENAFLLALRMGNEEQTKQEFDQLFAQLTDDTKTVDHLQRCAILLFHSMEKQLQSKDIRMEEVCGKNPLVYIEMIKNRNDAASIEGIFTQEVIPAVLSHYQCSVSKEGDKIVQEVMKLINIHYEQTLSLHHIAVSYYMNPDYLSRIFKRTTGRSFVDYLTEIRIAKAKELMKASTYKNYEIAQMVGYEDYRYFSQIFKRKMGVTIGEYRSTIEESTHQK